MAISEFQQALIGVGAALVVGVWGYNRWQEYRYKKAAEQVFRGSQDDALINAQSTVDTTQQIEVEPSRQSSTSEEPVADRIEPHIRPTEIPKYHETAAKVTANADATGAMDQASVDVAAPDEACVDRFIELGIALPAQPTVAELHEAWRGQQVGFGKCVRWVARGHADDQWNDIANPSTSAAQNAWVTIQLADRQGAIDKNDLQVFCMTAVTVAAIFKDRVAAVDSSEVVFRAKALDNVCASVDVQVAIHIVSRSGQAFAGSKLRGLLEASGLQLAPDGLFYLLDAEGHRMLSVSNSGAVPFDPEQMRTGTTSDVTFWLDVPRVADGGDVFDTMLATARQLAGALDGVLVDDQRNPLADNVLMGIRAKVIELQTQMAAHGIPAGGRRALRLFA